MSEQQIQNNFEKISIKIESNSRGFTTSVHVYQGAKLEEIEETIEKAIFAHNTLQIRLLNKEVTA